MRNLILVLIAASAFLSLEDRARADVCNRTPEVVQALEKLAAKNCADIAAFDLEAIQSLNLSGATISSLQNDDFQGLTNLRSLDIYDTSLDTLPADLFSSLTLLEYLDLSDNHLNFLPEQVFAGLSNLITLGLGGNRLTVLPEKLFSGLTSLDMVVLTRNNLAPLPAGLFSGVKTLQTLYLGKTGVSEFPDGFFKDFRLLSLSLRDCKLSAAQLANLPNLGSLQRLDLGLSSFTAAEQAQIQSAFPKANVVF